MLSFPARILILSTIPGFTLNLVRTAGLAGYQPFLVTDQYFTCDWLSRWAHPRLVIEHDHLVSGSPEAINSINSWIDQHKIEVVVPADTRCTRMLARQVNHILNAKIFPLSSPELIDYLYDKGTFSQFLSKHQLPMPETHLLTDTGQLDELNFKFPVMVKPCWGESGWGIQKVDDNPSLDRAIDNLVSSKSVPFLIQEWIPGQDVDLNLIANQGELVGWMVQQRKGKSLQFIDDSRLVDFGRLLCRYSGYNGVAHVDMRIDERTNEIKIIEFNPRFWGSLLFSTWMGVNFLALGLQLLISGELSEPFSAKYGNCPNLCSSPSQMREWIKNGFQPPAMYSENLVDSWYFQMHDPLPEWVDVFWVCLVGRSLLASQQALLS